MFLGVCERAPKPSMQLLPSHHADDMGARLADPSGLVELTSTTGVPKYRIAGSMTVCIIEDFESSRIASWHLCSR